MTAPKSPSATATPSADVLDICEALFGCFIERMKPDDGEWVSICSVCGKVIRLSEWITAEHEPDCAVAKARDILAKYRPESTPGLVVAASETPSALAHTDHPQRNIVSLRQLAAMIQVQITGGSSEGHGIFATIEFWEDVISNLNEAADILTRVVRSKSTGVLKNAAPQVPESSQYQREVSHDKPAAAAPTFEDIWPDYDAPPSKEAEKGGNSE